MFFSNEVNSKILRDRRYLMNGKIQMNEKKVDQLEFPFFSNKINSIYGETGKLGWMEKYR